MPESLYPTGEDLMAFLYGASLIDSATAPTGRYASLGYDAACRAAAAEFERRTGRRFLPTATVELFDPVTDRNGRLSLGREWATITRVEVDGTVLTEGDDYVLEPYSGVGPPYRFLRFLTVATAPVPWGSLATVEVTGTRGAGSSVPDDVWQAVLQRAASILLPSVVGILTSGAAAGGIASLRLGDADVAFRAPSAGSSGSMGGGWDATFERTVAAYRFVGAV